MVLGNGVRRRCLIWARVQAQQPLSLRRYQNPGQDGLDNIDLERGAQTATPIPAALPLFATGLGRLGLLGWCRKQKDRKS